MFASVELKYCRWSDKRMNNRQVIETCDLIPYQTYFDHMSVLNMWSKYVCYSVELKYCRKIKWQAFEKPPAKSTGWAKLQKMSNLRPCKISSF